MRLFLTVISDTPARALQNSSDATASSPDTVALFDDGVWTRSGPSHDAVAQVSATFVAREIHRQAALTELVYSTKEDVVCFRYGPRPPPQLDLVFFHRRRSSLPDARQKSSSTRLVTSVESAGMSSPLITPSTSHSSERFARSLPSSSLAKSVEQNALPLIPGSAVTTSGSNAVYASVFSLWLLEIIAVKRQHVTVSGCLLSVHGTAVDLSTGHDIHAPLTVHTGAPRTLRCPEDVHAYLAQCEVTIKEVTSRRTPPVPFHMWVTVRVGSTSDSGSTAEELPTVTFLDLAAPTGATKDQKAAALENAARVQEQLRMFERQVGSSSAAAATSNTQQPPSPYANSSSIANGRWLGLLQSCQLTRARKVGIFSLTEKAPSVGVFGTATEELGGDPFALSAELRQRALENAVNYGVVHPQHSSTRERMRRLRRKTKKHQAAAAASPPKSASTKSVSPSSQHIESILDKSPQLPSLKRSTASFASRHFKPAQGGPGAVVQSDNRTNGSSANSTRGVDLFALLGAEEYIARGALEDSEGRARDLAWMRWALRAHPPNTSVTEVARQLSSAVSRLERPKVRSAPQRRPPPLTQVDLAATARAPSGHGSHRPAKASPSSSKHPAAGPLRTLQSPDVVREALPLISPPPSTTHAATSATARHSLHPEFLMASESPHASPHWRHGSPSSGAVSPQISTSPSRAMSGGRRRYSALEVALLERAHSSTQRSSLTTSPHNGSEVELLYPLIRTFHAELTAQDNVMAEELMARSKIELRELNRRRTLENLEAERGRAAVSTSRPPLANGRRYSASPRASRAFLDVS